MKLHILKYLMIQEKFLTKIIFVNNICKKITHYSLARSFRTLHAMCQVYTY